MADEHARLFLDLVTQGVQQAAGDVQRLARQTDQAAKAWDDLAEGWRRIGTGEYARRAQEMAALTREQQKLAAAQRNLDIIAREGKFLGNLTILQERLQGVGRVGGWAFGLLSVGVGGWVRAGMQGTAEAQRLALAYQQLGRAIGDIFAPWIQKSIDRLNMLVQRFRALSGEQQESVRRWVAIGAVISGTMLLLPRLIAMLHATAAAFSAVGLAKVAALAGPVGLGIAAGVAAVGIAAAATPGGRDAMSGLLQAFQPVLGALGELASTVMTALNPLFRALAAIIGPLARAMAPLLQAVGRVVEAFGPLFEALASLVNAIMEVAGPVIVKLAEWLATAVEALARFVAALVRIARWVMPFGGLLPTPEPLDAGMGARKTALSQAGSGFGRPEDLYQEIATALTKSDTAGRTADATELAAQRLEAIIRLLMELYGWSREQAMERARGLPGMGAP